MQERRLRPGDVLDDYCPRERRVTDHAIVAMIDERVKLTRCVTCDTEHDYKEARVPVRKRKAPAALFDQVLDGLQGNTVRATPAPVRLAEAVSDLAPPSLDEPVDVPAPTPSLPPALVESIPEARHAAPRERAAEPPIERVEEAPADPAPGHEDNIPFRRSLIRAQLPKIEGQAPPVRALPDFTIRQPQNGRPGRPGGGGGGGRRRPGGEAGFQGPMRSGRMAHGDGGFGQGQGQGQGRGRGPGRGPVPAGGRPERGGQAPPRGGRGRRGKKH
ncbi:MAG: hypothetical protein Q8L86_00265 [Vicinamibacterales bacterium]|nr:hypothetical protein [Vicinamibacterales bacterium]